MMNLTTGDVEKNISYIEYEKEVLHEANQQLERWLSEVIVECYQ